MKMDCIMQIARLFLFWGPYALNYMHILPYWHYAE